MTIHSTRNELGMIDTKLRERILALSVRPHCPLEVDGAHDPGIKSVKAIAFY